MLPFVLIQVSRNLRNSHPRHTRGGFLNNQIYLIASVVGSGKLVEIHRVKHVPWLEGLSESCLLMCGYRYNKKKLTYEERKNELILRLNNLNNAAGADDDDEDEDDE